MTVVVIGAAIEEVVVAIGPAFAIVVVAAGCVSGDVGATVSCAFGDDEHATSPTIVIAATTAPANLRVPTTASPIRVRSDYTSPRRTASVARAGADAGRAGRSRRRQDNFGTPYGPPEDHAIRRPKRLVSVTSSLCNCIEDVAIDPGSRRAVHLCRVSV